MMYSEFLPIVFGRAPGLPLELELGMILSNPSTRNEYIHTLRSVFRDVRQIAKQQLTKVPEKRAGHNKRQTPGGHFVKVKR